MKYRPKCSIKRGSQWGRGSLLGHKEWVADLDFVDTGGGGARGHWRAAFISAGQGCRGEPAPAGEPPKNLVAELHALHNTPAHPRLTMSDTDMVEDLEQTDGPSADDAADETASVAKKRTRTSFTLKQIHALERAFHTNHSPDLKTREEIGKSLSLSERTVRYWFQNRRQKIREIYKACEVSTLSSDKRPAETSASPPMQHRPPPHPSAHYNYPQQAYPTYTDYRCVEAVIRPLALCIHESGDLACDEARPAKICLRDTSLHVLNICKRLTQLDCVDLDSLRGICVSG